MENLLCLLIAVCIVSIIMSMIACISVNYCLKQIAKIYIKIIELREEQ